MVADKNDRVVLYAVTSCLNSFHPSFDADEGIVVTLQQAPLARAASFEPRTVYPEDHKVTEPFLNDGRNLDYLPGYTGTTPEHYMESWGQPSNASRQRAYFVGSIGLCYQPPDLRVEEYRGDLTKAPNGALRR